MESFAGEFGSYSPRQRTRSPRYSAEYRTPPPGRGSARVAEDRTPSPDSPSSDFVTKLSFTALGLLRDVLTSPESYNSSDQTIRYLAERASFLSDQIPSSGLWGHVKDAEQVEIPHDVQVIFGLRCSKSITSSQSEGASSAVTRTQPCHGVKSLQGIWRLAYKVHNLGESPPLRAFKQFKYGELSIIKSPPSPSLSPLQMQFEGTGAISDKEANRLCRQLGEEDMLCKLNQFLGTLYEMDDSLKTLLSIFVEDQSMDFGTAYGHLRRGWFGDVSKLQSRLSRAQRQHEGLRRDATKDGLIVNPRIPPRRVWDLYSNRVLPFWVLLSSDIPSNLWAVSHSWVCDEERDYVWTEINGSEWPVPIPDDVGLEQVRIELLNLGAEYVWLDVLCLRQNMRGPGWTLTPAEEKLDEVRLKEWRLDVPTIGHVYRHKPGQVVVTYFNGLGRPFRVSKRNFRDDRYWLNRVWTMQETAHNWLIGGLHVTTSYRNRDGKLNPAVHDFHSRMCDLLKVLSNDQPDLFALMTFLRERNGSKPNDSISALAYLLKCPCIPIYDQEQKPEDAWELLVQQLDPRILTDLLFLCAVGGNGDPYWRPSWRQLMEGDFESLPFSSSIDYSHRDLLRYERGSAGTSGGPVYSNYAYLIEEVSFVKKDGKVFARIHIAQRPGSRAEYHHDFSVSYVGSYSTKKVYAAVAVADLELWVFGHSDPLAEDHSTWFQKVSIFGLGDRKVREKLWHLNPGFADTKIYYV